ncbi:MAG TPA: lactate racemase domain-containing protein [Microthrixaceae bacterium]|nr:lactate racemase domain-containing protein [Microthrixaceae bacterium]
MTTTIGGPGGVLGEAEVEAFLAERLAALDLDGRSLCLVIPDATRRCPLPLLLGAITRAVRGRVRSCAVVVALGTHAPMDADARRALVGIDDLVVVNHEWWEDATFTHVGTLDADLVAELSEGRLREPVDVRVNRLVVESDVTLIVGPVLPHEVVGFSGGEKYLFPGLSGQELIDVTHWLGALITSAEIIGTPGITPVRALIHAGAALVPGERHACCVVVDSTTGGLESISFGDPIDAWSAAADVAAVSHVEYLDAPVQTVLSMVPRRYDDLWTGAKGFYKVEPVVADGGEVIIYAPHITEVAAMHPGVTEIGYHCIDYFLGQWDRFEQRHRGELAHSTHLFGAGTWDAVHGEHQRVRVTLATGIPEDVVDRINLSYRSPDDVDLAAMAADPNVLVVPDAGEVLYRIRSGASQ